MNKGISVLLACDLASKAIAALNRALSVDDDGRIQYELYRLYKQVGDSEAAYVALTASKAARARQLKSEVAAFRERVERTLRQASAPQ